MRLLRQRQVSRAGWECVFNVCLTCVCICLVCLQRLLRCWVERVFLCHFSGHLLLCCPASQYWQLNVCSPAATRRDAPPSRHPPHLSTLPASRPPCSFQWREQCHKCGIAKDSGGIPLDPNAAAAGAGGYGGYSADPYAAGYDASYGAGGASYGTGGGGGGGMQAGQNTRPGDWRCLGCGNVK